MGEQVTVVELDQSAEVIDQAEGHVRRGILTGSEAVERIAATVVEFISDARATRDEIELIWEYATIATDRIAADPHVLDPVLAEWLDDRIRAGLLVPVLQAKLDVLLERLELEIRQGRSAAVGELTDLCGFGRQTERTILSHPGAADQILRAAHRHRVPGALLAAVRPDRECGQIASHRHSPEACQLALNLLAHHATEPETRTGHEAREALVWLAGCMELAGEAAIRLPVHLLDDKQRADLLTIHEARVELFNNDPIQIPLGLAVLRDNRIVRSALWQAFDAQRV